MEQETSRSTSRMPREKILVIDDDEDYRAMITAALATAGYRTAEGANGRDGLEAVASEHPDLVLCDVNMPEMDGYTVLRKLKADPEYASIPFIFLTGDSAKDDLRRGMKHGADDYLTKPFTSDELLSAIRTRLDQKQSLQKYYELRFDDIKTSFVKSLPHEFRTPLHGILGYAQILMEDASLPQDEVKEIGAMIQKSAQRLHHLLENLILYGELQYIVRDREIVTSMRGAAVTTLREVVRSVAGREAGKQKRDDAMDLAVGECIIRITVEHLTKILEEVIDNALKFSGPGTKVHISSEDENDNVILTIRDEGRGMSREQLGKIAAFQQFDRRYYEQPGAGLGLTIATRLAELYGGSLAIDSAENIGTTVRIRFSRAKMA